MPACVLEVAQLPEEEAATRTLVSLELEEAIQSRSELELKQARICYNLPF